jgi:hypothetical protein
LFLSGCSKCASDNKNEDYEAEKMYMISSLDQKDNFSKLLYQNLETVDGTKYTLIRNRNVSKLKLKGYEDVIKNARVVEYDKKYYIKPGKEDFVLEFDYEGNFIEKRKMPDEEKKET